MSEPKKAPCIDVRTDVHKDVRFEVLGEVAGYNRFEALGRMHALWSWCRDRGLKDTCEGFDGYIVSEAVVRQFLGGRGVTAILGDGVDDFALAEQLEGGMLYLRGTSEYVAAARAHAATSSAGGRARAEQARARGERDQTGRFVSEPTSVQPEPSRTPAEQPAASQQTPASSSSLFPLPPSQSQNTHAPRTIPGGSTWQRHQAWWTCMLEAHGRLRKPTATRAAIKPGTPDLAKHPHEQMLAACERFLRDGGYDDAGIDAKMRHVVLVHEAEAEALGHLDFFKPALIWDSTRPDRFPRKVDTSLEEAQRSGPKSRASPRRAGDLIGSASPRSDHPVSPTLIPINEL